MRTLDELKAIVKEARKASVAPDITRDERDLLTFEDRVLRGYYHRLDGMMALKWIVLREREATAARSGAIDAIQDGPVLMREVEELRAERQRLLSDLAVLRAVPLTPGVALEGA
jgi:hypothetical protein